MNASIAIYSGSMVIYWSSIVIGLGLAACLCLSLALFTANGGRAAGMLLLLPLALLFSIPLCRALHWYCHMEQYTGFFAALTDYSSGSYCLPGALLGVWLAALLVHKLGFAPSTGALLDAFAPGAALAIAFIRLSAIFGSTCRSKITFTSPLLRHLPLASAVTNSSGGVDYRFATFFVQFIIMLLLTLWLVKFYGRRAGFPMRSGSRDGNVARMFLLSYSAVEIVLDSTRYDSSFFPFNSFISIAQVVGALCVLGILIYYSVHAVKARGLRFYHFALWFGFLLTLGAAGVSEYMVQRHGSWYLGCYAVMGVSCYLMVLLVYQMYLRCCAKRNKGV